ncbi:MAG: DNA alkylation repair protein [Pseudomonadota bacterium]
MARAPANFSLKDQLFNVETLGQLGREYAAVLPGFDANAFTELALAGVADRSLLACLDWFADCLEQHLARDFPTMADQLEAAMAPPLDPSRNDDDFGQFIHAVPGVLAVRHGLEHHRDRALDLLHAATQRFSMEFYVRRFLDRWPDTTWARLEHWAEDDNYHVRRLVSEGTRPKLPWAGRIELAPGAAMPLLDRLYADPTRYVTRSVANHLNDIGKSDPDRVLDALARWRDAGGQAVKELDWMARHSLRTMVKDGHPRALAHLGYDANAPVDVQVTLDAPQARIGAALNFEVTLVAPARTPVVIDYRIRFARPGNRTGEKVFKLKTTTLAAGTPLTVRKSHKMKAAATTFELHPGPHMLILQVNGSDRAEVPFDLLRASLAGTGRG